MAILNHVFFGHDLLRFHMFSNKLMSRALIVTLKWILKILLVEIFNCPIKIVAETRNI